MDKLLNTLYWGIGFMIVLNLGTFLAMARLSFKGVWWLSKLDARVKSNREAIEELDEEVVETRKIVIGLREKFGRIS